MISGWEVFRVAGFLFLVFDGASDLLLYIPLAIKNSHQQASDLIMYVKIAAKQ